MQVVAYTIYNWTVMFPARDLANAREIAKRIIVEGLWIVEEKVETFYPVHCIQKVKILPGATETARPIISHGPEKISV